MRNIEDYTLISGGCKGSDLEWEKAARKYGLNKVRHLSPTYYEKSSNTTKNMVEYFYGVVCERLGRPKLNPSTHGGKLVRRNMLITMNADSIFAVGSLVYPSEKDSYGHINNNKYAIMNGGTAYSVELGRILDKKVYVLDQEEMDWWVRLEGNLVIGVNNATNGTSPDFNKIVPKPTKTFAGIGTRGINGWAKERIDEVFWNLTSE